MTLDQSVREAAPRAYDIHRLFGQVYAHLLFQERFSISDDEWSSLFDQQWFPFATFRNETIQRMLNQVRSGWAVDELIDDFVGEIEPLADRLVESWGQHGAFQGHSDILDRAVERFKAKDYVSATGLLYPRIEGLLRSHHVRTGTTAPPSQKALALSAVQERLHNEKSLLLPQSFHRYLQDVYFASFDPKSPQIHVSRHSVSHGVASADAFNAKAALIGLLIVNQLYYSFEQRSPQAS